MPFQSLAKYLLLGGLGLLLMGATNPDKTAPCYGLSLLAEDVSLAFKETLRVKSDAAFAERVRELFSVGNAANQKELRGGAKVALDPKTGQMVIKDSANNVILVSHLTERPYGLDSRSDLLLAMTVGMRFGEAVNATEFRWDSLDRHFKEHKREFEDDYRERNAQELTPSAYQDLAKAFAATKDPECIILVNQRQETIKFNPHTEEHLVVSQNGTILSYYKKKSRSVDYHHLRAFTELLRELATRFRR